MKTLRPTRRRALALVAAAALTIGLTACGAGGGGDSGSDLAKGADGLTKLTVLRSAGGSFESAILADRLGYFKDAGLAVTFTTGSGDPTQNVPSLMNGELQFSMIDSGAMIRAVAQNLPVKLISGVQSSDPAVKPADGLLVPPSSSIKTLKDLEGKTVGVTPIGGGPQILNNLALQKAGVDYTKVKYVQLPVESLTESAKNGKVDAILPYAIFYDQAVQAGFTALTRGSGALLPGLPQVAWAATDAMIQKNPTVVKSFVQAMDKANKYANEHPDEVRKIDGEMTRMPAAYIANRPLAPLSSAIDSNAVQTMADAMKAQGFITTAVSAANIVWADAPKEG